MKKLFYLTILDDSDRVKIGIMNKIRGQISAMKNSNIDVYFGHIHDTSNFIVENNDSLICTIQCSGSNTRDRMGSIYPAIEKVVFQNEIDALYIRYISIDGRAIKFYQKIHNAGIKVIIEFFSHNLFLEHYKTALRNIRNRKVLTGIKGLASLAIDKFYCGKLKKCVDRIVTTTKSDPIFGIETINVTNGINLKGIKCRNKIPNAYDFTIMSVAMISPWHGYDRVIKGIHDYYKNGGLKNIIYYVIGDGEERRNLEVLTKELELDKHIKFEGLKVADELDKYYDEADVALEMLAGFRRTSGPISSIKMAEYIAKGLPVVYTDSGSNYPKEVKKYCYTVANDETTINIDEMITRIDNIYSNYPNLETELRRIVERYFTWDVTMRELIQYIYTT